MLVLNDIHIYVANKTYIACNLIEQRKHFCMKITKNLYIYYSDFYITYSCSRD